MNSVSWYTTIIRLLFYRYDLAWRCVAAYDPASFGIRKMSPDKLNNTFIRLVLLCGLTGVYM